MPLGGSQGLDVGPKETLGSTVGVVGKVETGAVE